MRHPRPVHLLPLLSALLAADPSPAQDTVVIGTGRGSPSATAHVPIGIRDAAGTPLGIDRPAGGRVQGMGLRVTATPASAVASLVLTRAGLATLVTPLYETATSGASWAAWVGAFPESPVPLPFTQPPLAPGDTVLDLAVVLAASAAPGSVVTLEVDASVSLLSNQAGTLAETAGQGTLSFVAGAVAVEGHRFFTLPPCRAVDTRGAAGPLGAPALAPASERDFPIAGTCGVPASARSLSLNVTVTGPTAEGYLTLFPSGEARPLASTINFRPGQTRANNATVRVAAGGAGALAVFNGSLGAVHVVVDVDGYYE